jgi:hypothetical protein
MTRARGLRGGRPLGAPPAPEESGKAAPDEPDSYPPGGNGVAELPGPQ